MGKKYKKLEIECDPESKKCVLDGRRVRATLTNCYFRCTKCRKIKPVGAVQLRRMPTGEVRNQPQCTKCRQAAPKKKRKA